jgi:cytochrome c
MKKLSIFLGLALLPVTLYAATPGVDEDAAMALLKKSDCFKCHALDKKKVGPAYKDVAAKYKGKADAEDKLYKHVTTGPKIKIKAEDGSEKEEDHKIIKSKDDAEIHNVLKFILSR